MEHARAAIHAVSATRALATLGDRRVWFVDGGHHHGIELDRELLDVRWAGDGLIGIDAQREYTWWDLHGKVRVRAALGKDPSPLRSAALDETGQRAILIAREEWPAVVEAELWDVTSQTRIDVIESGYHEGYRDVLAAFAPGGTHAILGFELFCYVASYGSAGDNGAGARVVELATNRNTYWETAHGVHRDITHVATSRGGLIVGVRETELGLTLLCRVQGEDQIPLNARWHDARAIAVSASGAFAASVKPDGVEVLRYDADSDEPDVACVPTPPDVVGIAFTDDDTVLWTFSASGVLAPITIADLAFP